MVQYSRSQKSVLTLWFLGVLLAAASAWAGTEGKIAGVVRDTEGQPLPGVGVTVVGTRLGATTDPEGRYLILRIPPGSHTVMAQIIGFERTSVTDVAVQADLTTQVDFRMREETIEIGDVVVVAERSVIEVDVTGSRTTMNAQSVSEAPVSQMLDFLSYEPGVAVTRDNELSIRGGGPSEIRFQVDGVDRTDALTSKGYTQLNQVLVSEVTVLTGGFSAEYGNVRSGMVNTVLKDGTERGFGLPWVAGVYSNAPAARRHFGPGAYDEDQYDYWLISSKSPFADEALENELYWPLLYEETRDAPQFNDPNASNYQDPTSSVFRVFDGWTARARSLTARTGAYGKKDWTAETAREAWEYEANMNEVAWQYGNEADHDLNLATGFALPGRLGGFVVGYTYNREMTPVPALIPYHRDRTWDAKLTLTPTDELKWSISYTRGDSRSTGGGAKGTANYNAELSESGASVRGADPVSLRTAGDLLASLNNPSDGNNKLHLSYNSPLSGTYEQWRTVLTYTFGPTTFATFSAARSESEWNVERDLARVDPNDWEEGGRFNTPYRFSAYGWLSQAYSWTDVRGGGAGDPPISWEDALDPTRVIYRTPYEPANVFDTVPTAFKYVTRTITFEDGSDPVTIVSPQGYVQSGYDDISKTYKLGGGGDVTLQGSSEQWVFGGTLTHATDKHTFKTGVEFITSDLVFNTDQPTAVLGTPQHTEFRSYGGAYDDVQPSYLGAFIQDKYETQGMIANYGLRLERFDGGQVSYLPDDLFNPDLFYQHGTIYFRNVAIAAGWDVDAWGEVPGSYNIVADSLGDAAPSPEQVVAAIPNRPAQIHWTLAPRFGISHPVSDRTKFFFNYGIFYSMQKASVMYGLTDHDSRVGFSGWVNELFNPDLRPARTTMYEIGAEHAFPYGFVATLRGYSKRNVDQVANVTIDAQYRSHTRYKNTNYEDVRGIEVKIARSVGRFVNGWFTYEKSVTRSGRVGLQVVSESAVTMQQYTAEAAVSDPNGSFNAMLRLSTPADWGNLYGSWAVSIIQSYSQGGQAVLRPDGFTGRDSELPDENFLPFVDNYNTNLKITKLFTLPGGRSVSAYVDITNLWNQKRLNTSALGDNYRTYLEMIRYRRSAGQPDLKVGDSATFDWATRPFQDEHGSWRKPLAARSDWMLFLNPRAYRFGFSFQL